MKTERLRMPIGESRSRDIALLEAILDELRGLRADLVQCVNLVLLSRRRPSSDRDQKYLERLLPAWHGTFGSKNLSVSELLQDPAILQGLDNMNAKKVGNLLARAADDEKPIMCNVSGKPIAYRVMRTTRENGRTLWMLSKSPNH